MCMYVYVICICETHINVCIYSYIHTLIVCTYHPFKSLRSKDSLPSSSSSQSIESTQLSGTHAIELSLER
jgi:hypothetical protein